MSLLLTNTDNYYMFFVAVIKIAYILRKKWREFGLPQYKQYHFDLYVSVISEVTVQSISRRRHSLLLAPDVIQERYSQH